jgi:hypothetical protein
MGWTGHAARVVSEGKSMPYSDTITPKWIHLGKYKSRLEDNINIYLNELG